MALANPARDGYGIDVNAARDYLAGRPTSDWQRNNDSRTNELLYAMAQKETDPDVQQAVMEAVRNGAFSGLLPEDASRALIQVAEERRAEKMNNDRQSGALSILAAELGPETMTPEMLERFGLDPKMTVGARADRLRSEAMSRIGQQRTGFTQQETRAAQSAAASQGRTLTAGEQAAIRNRAAVMYGRQQSAELGDIRRETEQNRQANLRQLSQTAADTVYEPGNSLASLSQPRTAPTFNYGWSSKGGASYGINMVGGNSQGTNRAGVIRPKSSGYQKRDKNGYLVWG